MHSPLALAAIAILALAPDAAPMRVDGVPVYGRVHDIAVGDLHAAIMSLGSAKPASIDVIDHDHIRAHLASKDLGWVPLGRCVMNEPDGSQQPDWCNDGHVIAEDQAALETIRTADQVFVFAVADREQPHRDERNMRLLDARASAGIRTLLGDTRHWLHGFDNTIFKPNTRLRASDIGFVFRKGPSEVVLFFNYRRVEGTFNGENIGHCSLDRIEAMKAWEERFARPEMPTK
ncbi:MAG TPA: hypothetical protein VGH80_05450 [Xanthomonadaceae bacterium]|jgi:hypothetical protein